MLKQERAEKPGTSRNVMPVKTGIQKFSLDSPFRGNDACEADFGE